VLAGCAEPAGGIHLLQQQLLQQGAAQHALAPDKGGAVRGITCMPVLSWQLLAMLCETMPQHAVRSSELHISRNCQHWCKSAALINNAAAAGVAALLLSRMVSTCCTLLRPTLISRRGRCCCCCCINAATLPDGNVLTACTPAVAR
jgi:hypothetical protein